MWLQGFRSGAGKYASGATTQPGIRKYRLIAIASQRVEFCTHDLFVSRGPAIWATVVALALINVGAAASIVDLMHSGTFWPLWVGLILTALGVLTLLVAVRLWQRYVQELRRA